MAATRLNAYNLLVVFTIIDVMLALNYKKIGLESLHQLWQTNKLNNLTTVQNHKSTVKLIRDIYEK